MDGWVDHDRQCEERRRDIRDWPARRAAPHRTEKDLGAIRQWRARAGTLLAGARAIRAEGSSHALHLAAMPEERELLAGAIVESETAELDRLADSAEEAAGRTGVIAFDTDEYAELMEHVREIEARPDLPEPLRKAVRGHLEQHEGWQEDRAKVDAFLDLAAQLLHDRERLARTAPEDRAQASLPLTWGEWKRDADELLAGAEALRRDIPERELAAHLAATAAGPGAIGGAVRNIEDRIAADEEARAEAERQRLADEQTRVVAERQSLEQVRTHDRSEGGGISMS